MYPILGASIERGIGMVRCHKRINVEISIAQGSRNAGGDRVGCLKAEGNLTLLLESREICRVLQQGSTFFPFRDELLPIPSPFIHIASELFVSQ